MHTWANDTDVPASLNANAPDAATLAKAQTYRVAPGDILNIETPIMHVGAAPELCLNLGVVFRRPSGFELFQKYALELSSLTHRTECEFPGSWLSYPLEEILASITSLDHAVCLSNGGLAGRPITRVAKFGVKSAIRLRHPKLFPVLQRDFLGRHVVAARGQVAYAPKAAGVTDWVENLAKGNTAEIGELLSFSKTPQDQLAIMPFLQWLMASQAVDVCAT